MAHTNILAAIKSKDFHRFEQLVELSDFDLDLSLSGITPLILSAKLGQPKVCERLIKKGVNLDLCDAEGRPALLHACERGYSEIVKQLILAGCDINSCSSTGDYALHESVNSGDVNTVRVVLQFGRVPINQCNPITGYSPLILALLNEHYNIVRALIVLGAGLNYKLGGDTALHFAVQTTEPDMVRDLIHAGCDMNSLNTIGETPLIVAIYDGRIDIAKLLILSGCHFYKYDFFSPLCVACLQNNVHMVNYLLSEGYDVSQDQSVQSNVLYYFEEEHPELLDYILTARATRPISLKELARVKVRRLLGPDVSLHSKDLSLPTILKDWVASDVIY